MVRIVKKYADRRSEIIEAACHLFQTKEYEMATMQEVMDFLNIAKGTIYHYFPSKEALFEAVVEHIVDTRIEQMRNGLSKSQATALEKFKLLISMSNMAQENQGILEQLHESKNSVMHVRLMAVALIKLTPLYEQVVMQGCKEGLFKTDTPRESVEFILAAVPFLTDRGVYPWHQEDIRRRINAFPDIVEAVLKAPKGSFEFLRKLLQ